jgi:hypothetical protein
MHFPLHTFANLLLLQPTKNDEENSFDICVHVGVCFFASPNEEGA